MTRKQSGGKLKVSYVVSPSFGYTFSGISYIATLIRHWKDSEITLELFGSDFPISKVDEQKNDEDSGLWQKPIMNTKMRRLLWTMRLLVMLVLKHRDYDIVHFFVQWWGALVSPIILHWVGKKAVYHITLLGSDNPSAVVKEAFGRLKLKLFKKFDGVIGQSPALIDDCRKWGFSSELLVAPTFYGINPTTSIEDEERLSIRQRLNIPSQAKVMLFVGSIIERKGVDLVLDAFIHLASQYDDLWLVLVGPEQKKENPRLDEIFVDCQKDKLISACVQDRVLWTGLISEQSLLANYYQTADLFFFPTRSEGQGIVILLAMAHGIPVVTTYLEGITDMMITSNQNGYLVELDNLEEFIYAIQNILENEELRQKMGASGREKALNTFGFEAYCENLSEFYKRVAGIEHQT